MQLRWSIWVVALGSALLFSACDDSGDATEESDTLDAAEVSEVAETTPTPDGVVIGAPCESTPEFCQDPGICSTLLPGGYCTLSCEDGACPEGSACRTINDFPFCMRTCESRTDCRSNEGYICNEGVCDKGCELNLDCDAGQVCQEGLCLQGCNTSDDCSDGQLCESGVCIQPERDRELGEPCVASSQCLTDICLPPEAGGVCGEGCTTAGCTLEGWDCDGVTPVGGSEALNLCVPGSSFQVDVVDPTPAGFGSYTFEVPSDAVSFLIVAVNSGLSGMYVNNIIAPDGRQYADEGRSGFTQPFRVSPNQGAIGVLLPNNSDPDLQMQAGTWTFSTFAFGGQITSLKVYIKRARGAVTGEVAKATLDLNLFIAPNVRSGLTAATAPENEHIQAALQHVRDTYWNPRSIELGEVRYYDIPSRYTLVETETELKSMFRDESPKGAPGGVNVFLVADILNGQAAGIAGGIPGTPGINETAASGVAVQMQRWPEATGDNITHELGHYLGLFHVSEIDNSLHDVISDTSRCSTPPYQLQTYDRCMDSIMYPILLSGFGLRQNVTAEQGRVIRFQPFAR